MCVCLSGPPHHWAIQLTARGCGPNVVYYVLPRKVILYGRTAHALS
jgi:hypothetical protein